MSVGDQAISTSTAATKSRSQQWLSSNAPQVALGAVVIASVVLLLALASGLTFFQDTWSFLINRRAFSADAVLTPHNEHIVVIQVLIQQLLLTLFGMTSAAPEYVLLILALAVSAGLLFVYVRRRLGPWPAVFAAALLLFLGPAWQDLLWPFEIGFVGSILFGIAMLLGLDRNDRRGDTAACVFLVISVGFSSLGLAFAVGAVVDVLQRRRSRGLRRAYVAVFPLLLYAVWYLGWGHDAESHLSLRNILASPPFVFDSLAASIDSLLGLSTTPLEGVGTPEWGRPILIALIGALIYGQVRKPGFSPRLWPVAASASTYWLLAAFNYIPGREPATGRYLYAGAAFVLLLAANLLQGARIGRRSLLIGAAVTTAAVASNLVLLKDGRDWLYNQTVLTKADLGAIEIAHDTVNPLFALTPEVAGTPSLIDIQAGKYLAAVREYGSPAYTPTQLINAPPVGSHQADIVLAKALPLSTVTQLSTWPPKEASQCLAVDPGTSEVSLAPGNTRIWLAPGPHASFTLRRFATGEYPVTTEGAPGASATLLRIPHDAASQPWFLHIEARQRALVCS
jgi:hypothetical protein